ncbi:hypothetical protein [Frankia gtarii]|uniref:hypothetical protein n=1 Tax=Frankia gtarii TaxID=2950102 RepID=UPI0021C17A7A|nr:hypothetical protein [Frankia gtarii]
MPDVCRCARSGDGFGGLQPVTARDLGAAIGWSWSWSWSDEELDEFLAFTHAERRRDVA